MLGTVWIKLDSRTIYIRSSVSGHKGKYIFMKTSLINNNACNR